jgi:TolB-like protein/Flp pilus assembly protein TadD
MGEQLVRNIARPIHVFRAQTSPRRAARPSKAARSVALAAGAAATLVVAVSGGLWWRADPGSLSVTEVLASLSWTSQAPRSVATARLSIVVLPFANLTGDPQQDYFVDGITESLTTDLSRVLPGSFVVARGTAFTYKGKHVDPGEVGRDLKVRYVLLGSVMTDGDRVRANAQLIDGKAETELWAERFDTERKDVLDIQDRIVGRLSRAVGLRLVDIEATRSEQERPHNITAIDYVMRGQAVVNRPASRDTMIEGRSLFQKALEYDRDNADALAGVATTYVFEVLNSYYSAGRADRLRHAGALLQRALDLEPRHIVALKARAALLRAQGQFDDAIAASKVVIAQNPGEPWAYKEVGLSELYLGRFQEAMDWFENADGIGPRDPSRWIWLGAMGRVQFFLGNDVEAIRLLRLSAEANPKDVRAYVLLAAIYALSDRRDEAAEALANALRLKPDMTIDRFFDDWSVPLVATSAAYRNQHERFREGLRRAGMPDC